ncbi:hypothetical protein OIU78_014467 [Salix suchowensis]|nr:hypothetical protein OIU78_014467 [Salix suchowensis]
MDHSFSGGGNWTMIPGVQAHSGSPAHSNQDQFYLPPPQQQPQFTQFQQQQQFNSSSSSSSFSSSSNISNHSPNNSVLFNNNRKCSHRTITTNHWLHTFISYIWWRT